LEETIASEEETRGIRGHASPGMFEIKPPEIHLEWQLVFETAFKTTDDPSSR